MVDFKRPYENYGRVFTPVGEESLTHQSFKDECDINNIVAKFRKSGLIDHVNKYQGQYIDATQLVPDYHGALNFINEASETFMSLPASIRERFDNDPGAFLDFVSDEDNKSEMFEMGLLRPDFELPDSSVTDNVTTENVVDEKPDS